MSNVIIKKARSEEGQQVSIFHGEGAYHGSAQFREVPIPEFEMEEYRPSTLADDRLVFAEFEARYPNDWKVVSQLKEPSQEEIQAEEVVFAWAPFDVVLKEASPLTKQVLLAMEPNLTRQKKHIYVDSKVQFFKRGDTPVDNQLWHVDGAPSCRDARATKYGFPLLHDMKARQISKDVPQYMAYQSSFHCATQWIQHPMNLIMPACIPSFDLFDYLVSDENPGFVAQPAASIVRFDGMDIHRAVAAVSNGWRLWIRCSETDKQITLSDAAIASYDQVFRRQ